jgi:hypothetical protein
LDVKASAKVTKYATITNSPFHPFILSTTGTLSRTSQAVFKHWQTVLTADVFRALELSLSVSLLRSRAKFYIL